MKWIKDVQYAEDAAVRNAWILDGLEDYSDVLDSVYFVGKDLELAPFGRVDFYHSAGYLYYVFINESYSSSEAKDEVLKVAKSKFRSLSDDVDDLKELIYSNRVFDELEIEEL